ncbi:MAG TPA: c-type cytochrome [Solirubrobacteraceae bacterium]|nr:c-type cytochrome [Solirubrobacteraceae bacterium]
MRELGKAGTLLIAGGLMLAALAGCGSVKHGEEANLIAGKQAFVAKCGACHTMARAGTKGTVGPNLDEAFRHTVDEGLGRNTIRGVVQYQVEYPNPENVMPKGLASGATLKDIAAYVAYAAARPGEDGGLLANATKQVGKGVATTPLLMEGKDTFLGSSGCTSCHTLADAGATGTVGPDLNQRLRSDCAIAASKAARGATLQQCIEVAITHPYKYIPSGYRAGVMPATFASSLSRKQVEALVAYLVKATEPGAAKH